MVGLAAFSAFSLLCGLAWSAGVLVLARMLQGAAAAILSPSVFSITTVTFEEGAERNKALGVLGAIAGSGAAIGVLLGGILTEYVGWEWVFFVNVPIGLGALVLRPPVRAREQGARPRAALRRVGRDDRHRRVSSCSSSGSRARRPRAGRRPR